MVWKLPSGLRPTARQLRVSPPLAPVSALIGHRSLKKLPPLLSLIVPPYIGSPNSSRLFPQNPRWIRRRHGSAGEGRRDLSAASAGLSLPLYTLGIEPRGAARNGLGKGHGAALLTAYSQFAQLKASKSRHAPQNPPVRERGQGQHSKRAITPRSLATRKSH